MKVSVDISAEYKEPYAVIYTDKVTDEIQRILSLVNAADYLDTLTVYKDRRPSPHKLSAAIQEYGYPVLGEHNALVDAGALLCLTCAMGDEREDLSSYINRFEIDPRYGLFGTSIEKVAYFLQDGMKPTELVKPHYKCR